MIKWLRRVLIIIAILLPLYWVVNMGSSYFSISSMQDQLSESASENTKKMMESTHIRFFVAGIHGLLRDLAMSCLCLYAAHRISPLGQSQLELN